MASVVAILMSSLALILAIFFTESHVSEASGFTVDLIHRDSMKSPSQRVKNAIQRSLRRVLVHNKNYQQSPSVDVYPVELEYLMKLSLGTPPVEILAVADTGSSLIWTQCQHCSTECFQQNTPLFNSNLSSSYRSIPCTSNVCTSIESPPICHKSKVCGYEIDYADGSISTGSLAKETITLGSTNVMIPNVTIGCAHLAQGTFAGGDMSGIVGLGSGETSLISQMGSLVQGKFSYCLVNSNENSKHSKMNFGDNAVVLGDDVVTTPILPGPADSQYFFMLEAITVGNQRLEFYDNLDLSSNSNGSKAVESDGNILVDSGTTLMVLPTSFYDRVVNTMNSQVNAGHVDDPTGQLSLCYDLSIGNAVRAPKLTAHFKGADVKLNYMNTYVKLDEKTVCLSVASTTSNIAIYGNLAQMNFLVGYDLIKKTVSFKPTDCTRE